MDDETVDDETVGRSFFFQNHSPSSCYTNKVMKLVAAGSMQAVHGRCHLPKVVTET